MPKHHNNTVAHKNLQQQDNFLNKRLHLLHLLNLPFFIFLVGFLYHFSERHTGHFNNCPFSNIDKEHV
tara:strand:- start:740 stop:943 length:204 start_codon:yes stop_codon:yes gene_type:complete